MNHDRNVCIFILNRFEIRDWQHSRMTPLDFNDCTNAQKYVSDFENMLDDAINDARKEAELVNDAIENYASNEMGSHCDSEVFSSQR